MNTTQKSKNEKNNAYKTAGIIAGIIAVIIIILLLFHSCIGPNSDASITHDGPGISYDESAIEGGWDEVDTDKIVDALNEKVEEGMINISMNTSPTFKDGTSAGNLMIVNEGVNRYPQVVEINRNDNGEQIYKSGAIPVGNKIEQAKLNVDLSAGSYECTALFYNVDPDTGNYLGCAGAIINITIEE